MREKDNYSEQDLIDNIDNLFPSIILKTQKKLSDSFIIKYILIKLKFFVWAEK